MRARKARSEQARRLHGPTNYKTFDCHPDTVLVAPSIIVGVTLVARMPDSFYEEIATGHTVRIDVEKVSLIGQVADQGQTIALVLRFTDFN